MQPLLKVDVYNTKNLISLKKYIMSKFSTILVALFLTINATFAQEKEGPIVSENRAHSFYVGIAHHYGNINGKSAFMHRIQGVYVAHKNLEVGVAAVGFYSKQDNAYQNSLRDKVNISGGYAGLQIAPIVNLDNNLRLSFPVLLGAGGIVAWDTKDRDYDYYDYEYDYYNDNDSEADFFFIGEAGLDVVYSFSKRFQVELGARYRLSTDYDLSPYQKDENIDGFSVGLGFKIGLFRRRG